MGHGWNGIRNSMDQSKYYYIVEDIKDTAARLRACMY